MEICGHINKRGVPCTKQATNSGLCSLHLRAEGERFYDRFLPKEPRDATREEDNSHNDELRAIRSITENILERYSESIVSPDRVRTIGLALLVLSEELSGDDAKIKTLQDYGKELSGESRDADTEERLIKYFNLIASTKRAQFTKETTMMEMINRKQLEYLILSLIELIHEEIEDYTLRQRLAMRVADMFGVKRTETITRDAINKQITR